MNLPALCIVLLTGAQEPGRPVVELPTGATFYVGQAIPLALRLGTAGPSARVVLPAIPGADIQSIEPDDANALGLQTDAPTATDAAPNRYFAIVPRKAGTLTVLAFTIRDGPTTLRTRPVRLEVRPVPTTGRPREFRGGVGPVELRASVDDGRVVVGDWLEFRLRLHGPGVAGMGSPPEIPVVGLDPSDIRVEPPALTEPSRLFERSYRLRVRPLRPGRLSIGPVALATFDPATGRFVTARAPGFSVTIDERPSFRPRGAAAPEAHGIPHRALIGVLLSGAAVMGLAGAAWLLATRAARARRVGRPRASRDALAGLARIDAGDDPRAAARAMLGALDDVLNDLELIAVRNPTPREVREAVVAGLGDEALAERLESLLAACVRMAFAPTAGPEIGDAPPREARALAEALARRRPAARSERRGERAG